MQFIKPSVVLEWIRSVFSMFTKKKRIITCFVKRDPNWPLFTSLNHKNAILGIFIFRHKDVTQGIRGEKQALPVPSQMNQVYSSVLFYHEKALSNPSFYL